MNNLLELIRVARELGLHAHLMEMATGYKKEQFNYSNFFRVLQEAEKIILEELKNEKEIKN